MGRPCKLTPEVQKEIVDAIREGCFNHVAAEAAGITYTTFKAWMASEDPRFSAFQAEVTQARAAARREAEREVFKGERLAWLKMGPGRATAERDGWNDQMRLEVAGDQAAPLRIEILRGDDWRSAGAPEPSPEAKGDAPQAA